MKWLLIVAFANGSSSVYHSYYTEDECWSHTEQALYSNRRADAYKAYCVRDRNVPMPRPRYCGEEFGRDYCK